MNWIVVSMDVIDQALVSIDRIDRCVWSSGQKCAGCFFFRTKTNENTNENTLITTLHSVVAYNLATSLWSSIPIWSRGGPEYERYAPSPRHTSRRVLSSVYSIVIAKALLCAMCFQSSIAYNVGTSSKTPLLCSDGRWRTGVQLPMAAITWCHKVRSVYSTNMAFTLITEEGFVGSWVRSSYGGISLQFGTCASHFQH